MKNKHKIFVVIFVGLSGFLVFKGWVFIKTQYLPAAAQVSPKERLAVDEDTDNDGLPDIEESFYGTDFNNPDTDGDGYLDGEEVASGYNPRLSAPSDIKPGRISAASSKVNLTERLTGRLSASITSGELDVESNVDDLDFIFDDIAYNTALETMPIFHIDNLTKEDLIISYKKDIGTFRQYHNRVLTILGQRIVPKIIGQSVDLEEMLSAVDNDTSYRSIAKSFTINLGAAVDDLRATPVPEKFIRAHLNLINNLQEMKVSYGALSESDTDVLKAAVASRKILEATNRFNGLLWNFAIEDNKDGFRLPDIYLLKFYLETIQ